MAPLAHAEAGGVVTVPEFACVDCAVTFLWDESPSTERCAQCAAEHAWHTGESHAGHDTEGPA